MGDAMNWILIILVFSSLGNLIPAITSVAMDSEKACQDAGVKAVGDLSSSKTVVKFSCSRK